MTPERPLQDYAAQVSERSDVRIGVPLPMAAGANGLRRGRMKGTVPIRTLFMDIGGVLLSDGWDHPARKRAVKRFGIEAVEMETRHQMVFDTYEEGKLTENEYLDHVVFFRSRPFTRAAFRNFMFAQSTPYPEMLALVRGLKAKYRLKLVAVSNEARVLNDYRIQKFQLDDLIDAYISSCYVHLRKPDADIFRLALDVAHTPAQQVGYVENTPMFIEIANGLGIRSVLHTDYRSTCAQLASLGLKSGEEVVHDAD
jgi:putative hydrolase of the HAD superfamily